LSPRFGGSGGFVNGYGGFSCGKKEIAKAIFKIILELSNVSNPDNSTDPSKQREKPTQQQQEERRKRDTSNPTTPQTPPPGPGPKPRPNKK
jgi:hypothetical protein